MLRLKTWWTCQVKKFTTPPPPPPPLPHTLLFIYPSHFLFHPNPSTLHHQHPCRKRCGPNSLLQYSSEHLLEIQGLVNPSDCPASCLEMIVLRCVLFWKWFLPQKIPLHGIKFSSNSLTQKRIEIRFKPIYIFLLVLKYYYFYWLWFQIDLIIIWWLCSDAPLIGKDLPSDP